MTAFMLTALLFPVFLFVLARILGLQRLMRLEMSNPSLIRLDDSSSDAAEDSAFASAHDWLLTHDFRLAAKLQLNPNFMADVSRPRAGRYYLSADNTVIALVTANQLQENGKTSSLLFASRDASGNTLVTTNRSMDAGLPLGPHLQHQDAYADNDEAQYQLHRRALDTFAALPCSDIDEAIPHSLANSEATLAFWQQSGWIHREPTSHRLSLKGAWLLLQRTSQHQRRLRTLPAMLATPAQDSAAAGAASQENFIRDVLAITQPGRAASRWRNTLIFLGTLGLFLLLGNFQWGLSTLLILLLVLVIHELGHFLAMRASGYRDVSIFFLPLLGAATTGRHDHAGSRQKLVVFLAGPVPGIVLGLGLLLAISTGWLPLAPQSHKPLLLTFIAMLLAINYLNLLPVTPFDGGRVMEILFFSRFPRANFYFYALCVAAFALACFYSRDNVLLVLLLVLAAGLPVQWRLARVAAMLRPEFGRHPQQDDAIRTLATTLARPELKMMPATQRSLLVAPLLARLQQEVTPWRITLAGSAVYAALLALPLVLLLPSMSAGTLLPGVGRVISNHAADDYRQELERKAAAARTPQQKMTSYSELANYLLYSDDEAAYRYANLAQASITPELDGAPEAADARMALADILATRDEPEKARALYIEAYGKLQHAHPEEHDRLGLLLQQQADMLTDEAFRTEKTRLAEQAYQHFVLNEYPENRLMQGEEMALLLHQQGRDGEAETLLRKLLAEADNPEFSYWQGSNRKALAWLLVDTNRAADSVQLLQGRADGKAAYDDTPRALAWAQLLTGHADAARQTLNTAFKAREDAAEDYGRLQLAFYQVDEALTWRAGQDTDAAEKAKQRLQSFLEKNKVDGNTLARQASYEMQRWPKSLAKAELALLEEMGYSDASQCTPGNGGSDKDDKTTNTASAST